MFPRPAISRASRDAVGRFGALSFLEERGIDVPGDISVMGFGNTADSLNRRLTTYSFEPESVSRRLVATALGGPAHLVLPAGAPEEIPGHVVERDSTGRARAQDG
jgi:DNA-binding LacI/PurR family transcriptional regulator